MREHCPICKRWMSKDGCKHCQSEELLPQHLNPHLMSLLRAMVDTAIEDKVGRRIEELAAQVAQISHVTSHDADCTDLVFRHAIDLLQHHGRPVAIASLASCIHHHLPLSLYRHPQDLTHLLEQDDRFSFPHPGFVGLRS